MLPDLFENLNPQQIDAVKHKNGPALVVAGPGSGKTRVLTHRVAYLIQDGGLPETNILCVTFTNKAANEVKSRVSKLLSSGVSIPWGGTFHSICARILRKDGFRAGIPPSFVIYDTDDQASLVKGIVRDFNIDPKKFSPSGVLTAMSSAKSELVLPLDYEKYARGYFQKTVAKIYPEYQKRLRKNNALDFDDLLMEVVNIFRAEPEVLEKYQNAFLHILVDEYQDTNKAQYVLTKLLAQKHKNLFAVGDMSQAIYSFRGADYRNILNFQNDYPKAKVYNLEQNYRSTQVILDAAKSIVGKNPTHIPLDLWTKNAGGEKLVDYFAHNEKDEAYFVVDRVLDGISKGRTYRDFAVLYRTNAQSRNMEENLLKNNIPYKIFGGTRFYARREVKDVVAFLRVIHNPKDSVSWERIVNVPPRGVGQKSVEELKTGGWDLDEIGKKTKLPVSEWLLRKEQMSTLELMEEVLSETRYAEWLDDGSEEGKQRAENIKELKSVAAIFVKLEDFLENVALMEGYNKADPDKYEAVTLMTIHSAKGLEFPVVFIIGLEEGLFPHMQAMEEQGGLEEERRLCYVAVTRAKEKVFLTHARSRLYFGGTQVNLPSRFIGEIPRGLVDFLGGTPLEPERFGKGTSFSPGKFLDELERDRTNFSWDA